MATLSQQQQQQQQDANFANMSQKLQDPQQMQTKVATSSSSSSEKSMPEPSYQTKKLGDLMNEMDELLAHKRYEMRQSMSTQMKQLLTELQKLYEEIEEMANSKETPDPAIILAKQLLINDIENQAVQGIYGIQGQIKPLTEKEQAHQVIMQAIPPGQATIRDLIERCHQLVTRLLDRVESSKRQAGEFSYDNRKLGDLLEDLDNKFNQPSKAAKTKVQELLTQLQKLHSELKSMSQQRPDLNLITQKQQLLNELENQAVFGVYGIQGQISPLHEVGHMPHHVRMEPIPPGQANVRGLIERCHQLVTRLLDRIEKSERLRAKQCSCAEK